MKNWLKVKVTTVVKLFKHAVCIIIDMAIKTNKLETHESDAKIFFGRGAGGGISEPSDSAEVGYNGEVPRQIRPQVACTHHSQNAFCV